LTPVSQQLDGYSTDGRSPSCQEAKPRPTFGEDGTGRPFRLEKVADGATYDLLMHGKQSTYEFKGFLRHGHCKHVLTLAEMILAGLL
jgi:hypothetical protein